MHQGGYGRAATIGAKTPAVIGAFDAFSAVCFARETAGRQGRGAVGADVAQGEDLAGGTPTDDDRLAQNQPPR